MRHLWALLLLVPAASGLSWSDDAGDAQALLESQQCIWTDAPPGWYPQFDVLEISLEEDLDHLWLRVHVSSLEFGDEGRVPRYAYYGVSFTWSGQEFSYYIRHSLDDQTFFWFIDADGGYRPTPEFTDPIPRFGGTQVTVEDTTLSTQIRKSFFHHTDWSPMRAGDVLENVQPFSKSLQGDMCGDSNVFSEPMVGDALGEPGTYTIQQGNPKLGTVFLFSPDSSRSSNGAETTYVFDVEARNPGSEPDELTLQLQVPKDWIARAPRSVAVEPGGTTPFQVAVTVPFLHEHGFSEALRIRGVSSAEPGKETELALTVYWTDPPQPGGHHPTVYFHEQYQFFSYMQTQPDSDPHPTYPDEVLGEDTSLERTFIWEYSLNPGLNIGLDFQPGAITGTSGFIMPVAADVHVVAQLVLTDEGQVLAESSFDAAWGVGTQVVDWTMPVDGVDRVPTVPGRNLQFRFELTYSHPENVRDVPGAILQNPPLMPVDEGRFTLPLVDYQDIISDDLASTFAVLSLVVDEAVREANPGEAAVLTFTAGNLGATTLDVEWTVEASEPWARVSATTSRIEPGASVDVLVAVVVPAGTEDGTGVEVLLTGEDQDTGDQVFARGLVTVTTTKDVPDQALLVPATEPEREDAPMPWLLPALVVAVLLRRR